MTLDLRFERWVLATQERVFAAFTDIEELRNWYTCDPTSVWTFHTWDAQVGGQLSVTISGSGYLVEVSGTFVAVEPPHRLVYDWNDELIELAFQPQAGGTLVRLHHQRLASDGDVEIRHGGWTQNLTGLDRHLTTRETERL